MLTGVRPTNHERRVESLDLGILRARLLLLVERRPNRPDRR
jgi:hypothetical protein